MNLGLLVGHLAGKMGPGLGFGQPAGVPTKQLGKAGSGHPLRRADAPY